MMGPAFGWNGTMIESGTPIWLDIGTTDLEAAKSFYRDLFGWNFTSTREDFGGYLMVDVGVPVGGAAPNMNEKGELDPSLPAWFTTYFKVDDIDAATADITAHGGQVFVAPMRIVLWAAAMDGAGEPVAYTYLQYPGGRLEVAFQMDTFVRRADRGHGLGMSIKAANLRQLHASRPDVARLHTWNAGENRWMLAINRELGFAPTSALGAWEAATAGS